MRFIESQTVLHTLNTFLGLKPFLYNIDRQRMERNWFLMVYSFLVAAFWQTITIYLSFKRVYFTDKVSTDFSNIDYVVAAIQLFGVSIFVDVITLNTLINSGNQLKVLNHLIEIENTLIERHNYRPDWRPLCKQTNLFVGVVVVFYFVFIYSVYVYVFHADLENWILFYLLQCFMVTVCSKNIENHCAFLEMCAKYTKSLTNTQVVELFGLYDKIFETFAMISQGYGLTIVGITIYNLISGIMQAYVVYTSTQATNLYVDNVVYNTVNFAWAIQLLVAQATLGYRAAAVSDEVRGFSKSFQYYRSWRRVAETEDFLIKDLHVDKAITAYGFYTLNEGTIFSVFCSIITYVVVLIEFKQLEDG